MRHNLSLCLAHTHWHSRHKHAPSPTQTHTSQMVHTASHSLTQDTVHKCNESVVFTLRRMMAVIKSECKIGLFVALLGSKWDCDIYMSQAENHISVNRHTL